MTSVGGNPVLTISENGVQRYSLTYGSAALTGYDLKLRTRATRYAPPQPPRPIGVLLGCRTRPLLRRTYNDAESHLTNATLALYAAVGAAAFADIVTFGLGVFAAVGIVALYGEFDDATQAYFAARRDLQACEGLQ